MGADRPLVVIYDKPVFPDKPWSPTVSQVRALIEINKGQPVKGDLLEALAVSFIPRIGDVTRGLLRPFNDASAENRLSLKGAVSQVVSFNIVNTPDYVETREGQEARSNLLALAVAQVGLEMMQEL